jgi:hypothetical protein
MKRICRIECECILVNSYGDKLMTDMPLITNNNEDNDNDTSLNAISLIDQ